MKPWQLNPTKIVPHESGHQIDAIFDDNLNPNPKYNVANAVAKSEIILFRDVMSRHEALLFGRDAVDRIKSTGKAATLRAFIIEGDFGEECDDLEKALALVQTVKGKHEYNG